MFVSRTFSLLLLGSLACGVVACGGSDTEATGKDEGAATIGIPSAPIFGEYVQTGDRFEFKFKGGPIRSAEGNEVLTIEGDAFGAALNKTPDKKFGWFTNTKWKCQKAEIFATDRAVSEDPDQDCYMELNPVGGNGFAVSIIGLDEKGQGLKSFVGTAGPRPAPVNDGAPQPVTAGPPKTVNVTLDRAAIVGAMVAVHERYQSSSQERNDCLRNARTGAWLDIQTHYYCLYPYKDVRTCYSTKLVEAAGNPDPAVKARAVLEAYDGCFKNGAEPNMRFVHDHQEAFFKYVMFTRQGAGDFDIESENAAISEFYEKIGERRPRRVVDTFPHWLPDQPRYEAIRKLQLDAQQAAVASPPAP